MAASAASFGQKAFVDLMIRAGSLEKVVREAGDKDVFSEILTNSRYSWHYGNVMTGLRLLKEHGADVNADGGAPIYYAAMRDRYEKATLRLISYGAKPQPRNFNPLVGAALGQNLVGMKFFLRRSDASVNTRQKDGWTPLAAAASTGYLPNVQSLLKHGAKLSIPGTPNGGTALHATISANRADVVKFLLRAGINRSARDKNGRTAPGRAATRGQEHSGGIGRMSQAKA